MITRCKYQTSNDIGVFSKLTNTYCIVGDGGSNNFYNIIETQLQNHISIIQTSIAGTNLIGSMLAGNNSGLLVPFNTTPQELATLKAQLPPHIKISTVHDNLSALGNCIACNDKVALISPEFSQESETLIAKTLNVDVYRTTLAGSSLVGSLCSFNNKGGIFHPLTNLDEFEELSHLLGIPMVAGTINRGNDIIGGGLVSNDWTAFCGWDTTASEIDMIEKILGIGASGGSEYLIGSC
jgi:translation initiation factor 6